MVVALIEEAVIVQVWKSKVLEESAEERGSSEGLMELPKAVCGQVLLKDGSVSNPPEPEPEPPTIEDFKQAIQSLIDETAVTRRYSNGVSLASYVNSTIAPWAAEAVAFVAWRDAVWSCVYSALEEFEAGTRETPTIDDLLAELPKITWP